MAKDDMISEEQRALALRKAQQAIDLITTAGLVLYLDRRHLANFPKALRAINKIMDATKDLIEIKREISQNGHNKLRKGIVYEKRAKT